MNQITHFLDASNVYGSTDYIAKKLRELQGGLLKSGQDIRQIRRETLPVCGEVNARDVKLPICSA